MNGQVSSPGRGGGTGEGMGSMGVESGGTGETRPPQSKNQRGTSPQK